MYLFYKTHNKLILPTDKHSTGSFLGHYANLTCGSAALIYKVGTRRLPFRFFVFTRSKKAVTSNEISETSLKSNYFFSRSIFIFQKKLSFLKKDFSKMLCLLLLGFLTGNIFGSFLNTIRHCFIWDGFITFCLITFIEFISYLTYKRRREPLRGYSKAGDAGKTNSLPELRFEKTASTVAGILKQTNVCKTWFKFANLFKIGLLIGFFVDAFKVGS